MEVEIISVVTLGAVILGSVVNVATLVNKRDAQVAADAKRDAKLDSLLERMEELSILEKDVKEHGDRITVVEQVSKAMSNKLDDLYCEHKSYHYIKKPISIKED